MVNNEKTSEKEKKKGQSYGCTPEIRIPLHQVWYQGGVKATLSGVVEDLKFKISEGSDENWCFPDFAQLAVSAKLRQLPGQSQENTNLGPNLLKF